MKRPLLPYEHQLVEALGVSEQEYLDFWAATRDYSKSPEERLADPQASVAVVALVLTIVGMVFQVAAALLAPTPKEQAQRRNREQRFSPRYGFNSAQELAQYGDPLNLVYCNTKQNKRGAVRVGTSLVWSSVEGYGSSQFMQLLLVLGASRIKTLAFERTAFGQLPLGQFSGANTWLYYNADGRPVFNDERLGDGKDPTKDGDSKTNAVCRIIDGGTRLDGFSQTFSPTSLTAIGVYDPIPLNIDIQERRTSGTPDWANLGIKVRGGSWGASGNDRFKAGDRLTIVFEKALKRQDKVAQEAAKDLRYQSVSSLDQASTYILGSAKFKLVKVTEEVNLDKNEVEAVFECVEAGHKPSTPYDETKARQWDEDDRIALEDARDVLSGSAEEATATGPDQLRKSDRSVFNRASYAYNEEDYTSDTALSGDVNIRFAGTRYSFQGVKTIKWKDELDRDQSYDVPQGGSIAYSQKLFKDFAADKPTLSVKELRNELDDDLEQARALRDKIMAGKFDKELRKQVKESAAFKLLQDELQRRKQRLEELLPGEIELDKKVVTISGNKVLGEATNTRGKGSGKIAELEKQIERLREDKDDFLAGDVGERRNIYVEAIRNATVPFVGLDGNRYPYGIKQIKRRLNELSGEKVTDKIGAQAIRSHYKLLIKEKEEALSFAKFVTKNWEDLQDAADDNFYTKCIAKADYAAYQTVTACDFVKFSIRCKLFRRIQGRQKKYGEKDAPDGYKMSDNGIQGRMAFFKVEYRKTGASSFDGVPIIFAVRRAADQDNFLALLFKGDTTSKYEFRFLPIGDITAEILDDGQEQFAFIENSGKRSRFNVSDGTQWKWVGDLVNRGAFLKNALEERGPVYTNEWDLFSNRSDTDTQFSFESGPEFRITSVTEQQVGNTASRYEGMSMMALGVYSGKGVQDLRSITAYVTEGKESYVVNNDGSYSLSQDSTSYAPDIFADTVLDSENGIGKYAKEQGIDWQTLALSKRFCKNNGLGTELFMDGVIADPSSWRQFWAETAPFSLLELARVGGKDTLIPAIPCDNAGRANRQVQISAMFTAGNVLEGSYKEEFLDYGDSTQDLIATIIYRDTEQQDVFPRDASVQVALKGVDEETALRQTFDLSQFVSTREQAILYGKLLCNQRRWVRKGLEFKTFPTDSPISPGAYIYVDIGLVSWQRTSSGIVGDDGSLNAPLSDRIPDGTYSMLLYKSGGKVVSLNGVSIVDQRSNTLRDYEGQMFVLGVAANRKRVFRATEVSMDEEGEITVKAVEHPCEESGALLLSRVADFSDELFRVV